MVESIGLPIFACGILIFASILISPLAARINAPLLLVFLALGMLAGKDGFGGINFDNFSVAYLIGSVALAIILFDGGLSTSVHTIKVAWGPALVLATVGVLITAGIVGVSAVWLLDMSLPHGLLLGSVVASTDAAAVFMLLQQRAIELRGRIAETLEVESGINDPMAIFLTIVCVDLVQKGNAQVTWSIALDLAYQFGIGAAAGCLGGIGLAWLINRLTLALGLYSVLALSGALILFGGTQWLGGSGFLAIYLAGILLKHYQHQAEQQVHGFHDGLAWLSQIVLFLMLGLLVTPRYLDMELAIASVIAAVLMLIARPLAVLVCLAPFSFTLREQLFIGWMGLRGAVPIFLAIIPVMSPGPITIEFFDTVFIVVVTSLIFQGWSGGWLAKRLGLEAPPSSGT